MIPNPNIYNQSEAQIVTDLSPVSRRQPKWLAWLTALLSPVQWEHDLIFNNYADGSTYPDWVSGNNYSYLDRIIFTDNSVYELQNIAGLTSDTITPPADPTNWLKVADSFIGMREQMNYNFQKLKLEMALNRYFRVSPYSLIEWAVTFSGTVPTTHAAPPYTQIYIVPTRNTLTNFWLSNGGIGSLTSYMPRSSNYSRFYLGNAYSAYSVYQFTVYVPTAVYSTIGANQPPGATSPDITDPSPLSAGGAIRGVINKYALAGSVFQIVLY